MRLIKTWRWFGDDDPADIKWLKQQGVEELVTALHHIPNGEVWPVSEIRKRKQKIEEAGLKWTVVESLPVSEEIKTASELRGRHIENYKQSIKNLAACGIKTVVYNFMPVIDWIRTDLNYELENLGGSMLFDWPTFAAFDIFILQREGAANDYSAELQKLAKKVFEKMRPEMAENLAHNIIVITQGFIDGTVTAQTKNYRSAFLKLLKKYAKINENKLRTHLAFFLEEVIPVAESVGVKLAIHPDDPPFPVLGLPRIFSTLDDICWLEKTNPSLSNGIAFCAGSFSARADNDVVKMAENFSHRIAFAHIRNTTVFPDGSFYESGHQNGRVDVESFIGVLHHEMEKRKNAGENDFLIRFRPDHGFKTTADLTTATNPGYPIFGRMNGLKQVTEIEQRVIRNKLS